MGHRADSVVARAQVPPPQATDACPPRVAPDKGQARKKWRSRPTPHSPSEGSESSALFSPQRPNLGLSLRAGIRDLLGRRREGLVAVTILQPERRQQRRLSPAPARGLRPGLTRTENPQAT